jgi:hypothetical protein
MFNTIEELRSHRNTLLQRSDAWCLFDYPNPNNVSKEVIQAYRIYLRDLPQIAEEVGLENFVINPSPL